MKVQDRLLRSLRELENKLGIRLDLPLQIDDDLKSAPAWTDGQTINVRADVAKTDPDNLKIYLLHELGHPLVGRPALASAYPPRVSNIAEDYIINQWMFDIFGYDVRKCKFAGIFDPNLGRLPYGKCLDAVSKLTKVKSRYSCNCSSVLHPDIAKVVRHLKKTFDINPYKELFITDGEDEDLSNRALNAIRDKLRITSLPVDNARLSRGLFTKLFMETPVSAKTARELTLEETIVHSVQVDTFRKTTVGDVTASAAAVSLIVKAIEEDPLRLSSAVRKAKAACAWIVVSLKRGSVAEVTSSIQTTEDEDGFEVSKVVKNHSLRRMNAEEKEDKKAALARAKLRFEKLSKLEPIQVLHSKTKTLRKDRDTPAMRTLGAARKTLTVGYVKNPLTTRLENLLGPLKLEERLRKAKETLEGYEKLLGRLEESPDSNEARPPTKGGDKEGRGAGSRTGTLVDLSQNRIGFRDFVLKEANAFLTAWSSRSFSKSPADSNLNTLYDFSNNTVDAIQSDLGLLGSETTRLSFLLKYASDTLLTSSPSSPARAPVIINIDGSGSMAGEPYATACGFALAMAKRMEGDRRGFALNLFSGEVDSRYVLKAGDKLNPHQILEMISRPSYGGTEVSSALKASYDHVASESWKKTNIVVISDMLIEHLNPVVRLNQETLIGINVSRKGHFTSNQKSVFDKVLLVRYHGSHATLEDVGRSLL